MIQCKNNKTSRSQLNKEKGFTLVELVLTLLVSSMIIAAIYAAYTSQQHSQTTQSQVIELQQNLRATMNFLTTEIRMAGYDKTNLRTTGAGIVEANVGRFRFSWDKDEDGKLIDGGNGEPDENIQYKFTNDLTNDGIPDDDTAVFAKTTFGAGMAANPPQEIAANIERIEFYYVLEDTSDNNIYDPIKTTLPTAAQIPDIRAITITLLARAANPDKKYNDTKTYTAGSGTVWPAYNDNYRRRLLITTVKLRNLGL